jgi:cyclic beta-1,2-glucan synthetase
MFEYLMPALWFKHYPRTLLEQSARVAVQCQMDWAKEKGMPWGISEAAYNLQDPAGHYQYRAFGVPALAINPNPEDDVVVSPYATFLALAFDPRQAVRNLQRMTELGWLGDLGYYDSIDFAPARVEPGQQYKVVPCWMAHHSGMSLLAACNLLTDGAIQKSFHSEPAVCATELLLHEKLLPFSNPIERARQRTPREGARPNA